MADPIIADRLHLQPQKPVALRERDLTVSYMPVPLTSFVGRKDEASNVFELLRDQSVRLTTLTGPGGVGKTRLALWIAHALEGEFADGAAFVPLRALIDASLVAPAIAHVMNIRETSDRPIEDRLVDALRERQLLLVIDNVEHVIDAAPLIATLLASCPQLTILTTSRVPLTLSGEHVITIPPFNVPTEAVVTSTDVAHVDSVQLFVARVRAANHGFALTIENVGDVTEIVRRLDGLPLAIELAAARIAHSPRPPCSSAWTVVCQS